MTKFGGLYGRKKIGKIRLFFRSKWLFEAMFLWNMSIFLWDVAMFL